MEAMSVSVIIPTLNEEGSLAATLRELRRQRLRRPGVVPASRAVRAPGRVPPAAADGGRLLQPPPRPPRKNHPGSAADFRLPAALAAHRRCPANPAQLDTHGAGSGRRPPR